VTAYRGQHIGIVFQQFHLMPHLTALENVALPDVIAARPDWRERASKLLTDVGLAERLEHFPSELSGGECQRVAIARALVTEPKLLLADEPTGNLDVKTAATVMDQFFQIVKDRRVTLLMVTHSEQTANRCHLKCELKEGRLWF
jgi:putative ABC transport system ATP-binding protein